MGVDTKGVILTSEKEFWKTSQKIGHAIYQMILPEYQKLEPKEMFDKKADWRLPKMEVSDTFFSLEYEPTEYFRIHFTYKGEQCMLHVHTDCDCDLKEQFGEGATGIILSFGQWGSSVEIMEKILKECSIEGEKWILEADYNDDWRKV